MLKISVDVNLDGIMPRMEERFGNPSNALGELTIMIFEASTEYMPAMTGDFMERSRTETESVAKYGKIIYPGPFAHFLWRGHVFESPTTRSAWAKSGETKVLRMPLQELQFATHINPKAQSRWTEASWRDNKENILEEFQTKINEGDI